VLFSGEKSAPLALPRKNCPICAETEGCPVQKPNGFWKLDGNFSGTLCVPNEGLRMKNEK
jgi:hypothetical protein